MIEVYASQVYSIQDGQWTEPSIFEKVTSSQTWWKHSTQQEEDTSIIPVRNRTSSFHSSFIPTTIRTWNSLDVNIRKSPLVVSFKHKLKITMIRKCNGNFSMDKGKAVIFHTCIQLVLSSLNQHMCTLRIVPSLICHGCNT